ncbi:MAG: DUF5522 domain-containing protein [Verrucomicrobiota bacterium]|nr:DUF5522 domain-containing protein [Verrucomicrobiota bacterium]
MQPAPRPQAGDFYFENGSLVLTAQGHRRRGYCCGSGCRHCPFDDLERAVAGAPPRQPSTELVNPGVS